MKKPCRIASSLIACVVLAHAARAAAPMQFPFYKVLQAPDDREVRIGAAVVDDELFAHTDRVYANLRIFDEDNVEIPFLVRPRATGRVVTRQQRIGVDRVSVEMLQDNRIRMVFLRKPDQTPPGVIEFVSRQRDFERHVTVFGSDGRTGWQPIAVNQPIFDYSRHIDIRNMCVTIPVRPYLSYKIEIRGISESRESPYSQIVTHKEGDAIVRRTEHLTFQRKDFKIDAVRFIASVDSFVKGQVVTTSYEALTFADESPKGRKVTYLTFDTARQPLDSVRIVTSDSNFSRAVRVEGADAGEEWKLLGTGTIVSVKAGEFQHERLAVLLRQTRRLKRYRLTIDNLDSPPLDISGVVLSGPVHEIVFFGERGTFYRLVYGGRDVPAPRYDIGDVLQKAEGADTTPCSIAPQQDNLEYGPKERSRWASGHTFFIAAILIMVGVLAWVIAVVSKKVDQAA